MLCMLLIMLLMMHGLIQYYEWPMTESVTFILRYYDDFHTIDWVRDRNKDRLRHKRIELHKKISVSGYFSKIWDAGSGWMLVFLVGVASGLLAGKRKLY